MRHASSFTFVAFFILALLIQPVHPTYAVEAEKPNIAQAAEEPSAGNSAAAPPAASAAPAPTTSAAAAPSPMPSPATENKKRRPHLPPRESPFTKYEKREGAQPGFTFNVCGALSRFDGNFSYAVEIEWRVDGKLQPLKTRFGSFELREGKRSAQINDVLIDDSLLPDFVRIRFAIFKSDTAFDQVLNDLPALAKQGEKENVVVRPSGLDRVIDIGIDAVIALFKSRTNERPIFRTQLVLQRRLGGKILTPPLTRWFTTGPADFEFRLALNAIDEPDDDWRITCSSAD